MKFNNKVVWITGASSGIGKQLALTLSKTNCKLILSSRRQEELEHVRSSCYNPENIMVLPFDLYHYANMKTIVDDALKAFGRIDVLINNGGISQRSPIINTTIEVDKKLMEIDYLGTVALSKALLPHYIENQFGHYVVVSSLMGKFSSPFRSAYCGAKHALHGFFDALRLEHDKDNVKVTMICPGFVNTNVARNALTADGSKQGYQDKMTENGLPVDVFVKRMVKAIEKEKFEAYIGKFEKFGVFIKRLSPKLLHKLVLRSKVK
ncbi:SDR family oxidoreductase [Hanstruepera flava]|uniref:SDR family oxidoreductase n=1 Tax=Hanstruepera flava TaxID=2930218 RepID=UPI0020296194|nr:SDR family oxidoreductase [Hanstruepera flava]